MIELEALLTNYLADPDAKVIVWTSFVKNIRQLANCTVL